MVKHSSAITKSLLIEIKKLIILNSLPLHITVSKVYKKKQLIEFLVSSSETKFTAPKACCKFVPKKKAFCK